MQHLRGHDHRFLVMYRLSDQYTLDTWDLLLWHFDTQVATGNHDAECHIQDLIGIVNAVLVLDLGNDLDRAVQFIQDLLNRQHILFAAYERVGNEIHIVLGRQRNEITITPGDGGQADAHPRYIDTLATSHNAIIQDTAEQIARSDSNHFQINLAIIDQHIVAHFHLIRDIGIGDINGLT